jgi:ubiquinone/menaquinone biosynthesis C-methylase UbiE
MNGLDEKPSVMTPSAPQHFDAIAGQYAASEVHAHSPTIRRLHELLAGQPPASVCDVACGPGHLALSFAGQTARLVGVDAAPNMLLQFEPLARAGGVKVETVHACAEDLPFPDHTFDAVVSRLAPHHFPDAAQAVREMTRVAKAGGWVAVIDLEGDENPALDDLNHELERLHDPTHVRSHTAARWRGFFEAGGLTIEALEAGQTEIPGGLGIRRWCEIGATPAAAQAQIRARLAAAPPAQLAALGIRWEADDYRIPVRTLIILGRKRRVA